MQNTLPYITIISIYLGYFHAYLIAVHTFPLPLAPKLPPRSFCGTYISEGCINPKNAYEILGFFRDFLRTFRELLHRFFFGIFGDFQRF